MKQEEARRIATACLPNLLSEGRDNCDYEDGDGDGGVDTAAGGAAVENVLLLEDVLVRRVCGLWGGMGAIYRFDIDVKKKKKSDEKNCCSPSSARRRYVIAVKHIPSPLGVPDLTSMSFGDCRKSKAYQVEANFYQNAADVLRRRCRNRSRGGSPSTTSSSDKLVEFRIPQLYYLERQNKSILMCLEWIDDGRTLSDENSLTNVKKTLRWLATFHAASWSSGSSSRRVGGTAAASRDSLDDDDDDLIGRCGLHEIGSYWHLETRHDEHADMPRHGWEGRLRTAARAVHDCLQRDPMQCLVHGDVKAENVLLCSSSSTDDDQKETTGVTMCDYQYCGKGPPTKDLAYFFCSSVDLSSSSSETQQEEELLKWYYEDCLLPALSAHHASASAAAKTNPPPPPPSFEHLKSSL